MGITIGRVTTTNWKPSKESVDTLAAYVKTSVEGERPAAVVFQMHDSLVYMGRSIDGTTKQPFKDKQGNYHVEGDLVLAPKEFQLKQYKLMKPILKAVGQRPFIMVTPMRRYATKPGCCVSSGHVTNFSDEAYNEKMESDIEDVRKTMRSWLFADNIKRVVVIGPGPMMAKMGPECSWGTDPVHPLPAATKSWLSWSCPTWKNLRTRPTLLQPGQAEPEGAAATGATEEEASLAEVEEARPTGAAAGDFLTERAF